MIQGKDIKEDMELIESITKKALMEMANLSPKTTGFAYYIWVGPPSPKHSFRIKVVNEPGRIDPTDSFSLSIEDNPKVVAGKANIPQKVMNNIKKWITLNKEILIKHAKMEIDDDELKSNLKKGDWQ